MGQNDINVCIASTAINACIASTAINASFGGNTQTFVGDRYYSNIFSIIAGENITQYKALSIKNGLAFLWQDQLDDYFTYAGLSLNAATVGQVVNYQLHGVIAVPFSCSQNKPYFANHDGVISTNSASLLSQIVAFGCQNFQLFLKPSEAVVLQ